MDGAPDFHRPTERATGIAIFKLLSFAAAALLCAFPGLAQPAHIELLADVAAQPSPTSSHPHGHLRIGDEYYFIAMTPHEGWQVWKTDLSQTGTVLVTDYNDRSSSMLLEYDGQAYQLVRHLPDGGRAELRSLDRGLIAELSGSVGNAVVFGGFIWLMTYQVETQRLQLWQSDGDSVELFLETTVVGRFPRRGLAVLASSMLFGWYSEDAGFELWRTDGTRSGTMIVADLYPGPTSSTLHLETAQQVGARLLFFSSTNSTCCVVHSTDGTTDGTFSIRDVGGLGGLVAGERVAYISSDGSSYKTDGTLAGTREVDIHPFPSSPSVVGDRLIYWVVGDDRTTDFWSTDGTREGTELLWETHSNRSTFTVSRGDIGLFGFSDPDGPSLFRTDGTRAGTVPISDQSFVRFSAVGDLFFLKGTSEEIGEEPWVSDGTASGTRLLANISPDIQTPDSNIENVAFDGDAVFFIADDDEADRHAQSLWRWTEANGLVRVRERPENFLGVFNGEAFMGLGGALTAFPLSAAPRVVLPPTESRPPVGGIVDGGFGVAFFTQGGILFATDGSTDGTVSLGRSALLSSHMDLNSRFTASKGQLFFYIDQSTEFGSELGVSDGTPEGTGILFDSVPGPDSSLVLSLSSTEDLVFFTTENGPKWAMWSTDGTRAGTRSLLEVNIDSEESPPPSTLAAGKQGVYVIVADQLWWSDGSVEGTTPVAAVESFAGLGWPAAEAAVLSDVPTASGRPPILFRRFQDADSGSGLWIADDEGLRELADSGGADSIRSPRGFTTNGRVAYFKASSRDTGLEIWSSDGTQAGTVPIGEMRPGDVHTRIGDLWLNRNYLYFVADNGETGLELWRTRVESPPCPGDCAGDGTVEIADLIAGVRISLGLTPLEACNEMDQNHDGEVRIPELISAVRAALDGC